jgi:hypothetical protein
MRTQITLHGPLPAGLLCPDCGAIVSVKLVEPKLSPPISGSTFTRLNVQTAGTATFALLTPSQVLAGFSLE